MKKYLLYSFIFLFCFAGNLFADKTYPNPNQTIPIGERLVYKVTWLRIPVGFAEMHVKEKTTLNGREVIHVVATLESNSVLSRIFPVRDMAESWIDAKTFEAVQFEKKIDEPLLKLHERTVFDAEKKKGYYESFKTGKKKEFSIQTPAHDVFSAFFWARRQSGKPGDVARLVLSADQVDWELEIKVKEEETLKIEKEKVRVLKIDPRTVSEGKERKNMAWFYASLDPDRKPVLIIYKAAFGKVVGTLIGPAERGKSSKK